MTRSALRAVSALAACVAFAPCLACSSSAASPTDVPRSGDAGAEASLGAPDSSLSSDAPPPPRGATTPPLYLPTARQSPITPSVAASIRAILDGHPSRDRTTFIRLGDNLSHASHLLGCLDDPSQKVDLGALASAQPTIDWFKRGRIGGVSPFAHAIDLENQTPDSIVDSIMPSEIAAANPAFAIVMFGALNVYHVDGIQPDRATDHYVVEGFGPPMLDVVDRLVGQGIVPLVRSTAPRADSNQGPWTPMVTLVNAISRAIAQGRQVPFADFYADAVALGPEGYWSDGLHLSDAPDGPCVLTGSALAYGDDLMNRIALEQLDRVQRVVAGSAAPDADAAILGGAGTSGSPFQVSALPFGDLRAFGDASSARADYSTCGGAANEAAAEHTYTITLAKKTKLRAFVFGPKSSGATTYVHHFAGDGAGAVCKSGSTSLLELELEPGVHTFVVDAAPGPRGGADEYVFGLDPCPDGDATCAPEP